MAVSLSSIYGNIKNSLSKVGSFLSSGGQTASVISAGSQTGPNMSYAPKAPALLSDSNPKVNQTYLPNQSTLAGPAATNTPYGTIVYNPGGTINTLGTIGARSGSMGNSYGGPSPVPTTLNAGQRPPSSSSGSGGISNPLTSGAATSGASSTSSNFGSLSSSSLSSGGGISLPSAPGYTNVGAVNTSGLDLGMSDTYTKDANGQFIKIPVDPNKDQAVAEADKRKKSLQELLGLMPQKENLLQSPEVQAQQAEVRSRQQEVANYTAQLNSVVAKQNSDLLNLQGIGSREGVTETVYGGQQAEINREAAIKALPIQAQIAAAQGNLALAQDYLSQVMAVKKEQIDNDFSYNMAKFQAVSDFVKGEEKIKLDSLAKNETRAYNQAQDNLKTQDEWAKYAIENGKGNLVTQIHALNIGSPTFRQDLARITSQIPSLDYKIKQAQLSKTYADIDKAQAEAAQARTALPTHVQTRVQGIASQFDAEQAVKNYQVSAEAIDAVTNSGKTPTDDIGRIYAFAKVMDPNSVVREGEYKTVQAYSTAVLQRYGLETKRVFTNSGFLTDEARKFLLTTLNNRLASSKKAVDNIYNEYGRRIDKVTGRTDGTDYITDYGKAFQSSGTSSTTTQSGQPFDVASAKASGYTQAEIDEYLRTH